MKYFILTLVFLYVNLNAEVYTTESELAKGIEAKIYAANKCVGECFKISRRCVLNPSVCSLVDIEIDDTDKPIVDRTNDTDCQLYPEYNSQIDDCRFLTRHENIGTEEAPVIEPVLCTDKTYTPKYGEKEKFGLGDGGYFAYCYKHLGYIQKTVRRIRLDQNKKDIQDAQRKADRIAIETARLERIAELNEIRAMIKDINNSSKPPWEKKLLRRLIRELRD